MAQEIQWTDAASQVEYALVRDATGRPWNTSGAGAFESYDSSHYASYVIEATEQGVGSAYYTAPMPPAIPAGTYNILGYRQVGGSPDQNDTRVAAGSLEWNGSKVVPLSDLVTSGQFGQIAPLRIAKGVMIPKFAFKLVSSLDHVTPFTSGVVSGQINRDGAGFTALQSGAFTELGKGWYQVQALTSGDLNGNMVAVVFQAAGISGGQSDQRDFGFVTQRVSGSI